ncbi:hypothetical protein [Maridesulfovibrio hydrothermalis]|uniref:Uncharacterized protein n=1 Tax=Maridesulfovibrio hydrothermalis AM13 = DSM 14728 TaxID=1121451 RepID=L0R9K9_9BACT|nr:hypothetical protein [Maridesulfovibrio hydrothermalis]CCO23448.1 conserved protein of unknown function [Maridesulfovibrio hydrothermalis AM13 = DSM 14728]
MSSRYRLFDRSQLSVLPLADRRSLIDVSIVEEKSLRDEVHPSFVSVAHGLAEARRDGNARVLMIGAHVLRSGMQEYIFDLMEEGLISYIAVNGACAVHDFELALHGSTTECVATYISNGQFGLWQETGLLNDIVINGVKSGLGFGEAVGEYIVNEKLPHADISLFAKAYKLGIPITVHVGIGYDIVHEHPNCDGKAVGEASYIDFLIFAAALESLEGGVVMNFGSAVMAPEIYLKALSMVRNAAAGDGRTVSDFITLVCDLHDLPEQVSAEAPKTSAQYYFRPWKTMLVRTVADGGRSYYVRGFHTDTIPQLWTAVRRNSSS